MAAVVEYRVAITFWGKPEPDDPRSVGEQAAEQIEGLGWLLADVGADLEVLDVNGGPARAGSWEGGHVPR